MPNFKEGKLLGVPVISRSTGEEQARATFEMVQEWQLLENVRALVFDTTASNLGWKSGACVKFEQVIGRKLFWLACRHHVYERILSAVHKELFGKSSGPDNADFSKFRDSIWKGINTEGPFQTLRFHDRSLQRRKQSIVQSLKSILERSDSMSLPQDDYRECAELMLMLMGETPDRGKHWLHPGATHQARWMPSILYPAKMFAFSAQAGYDDEMVQKLEALCKFNALFYVEKWLRTSVGTDAAYNDLQLWHDLNSYKRHDAVIANAAIAALERHFWYLTEECVVFSLFSNRVSGRERQQMAQQLLKINTRKTFEIGQAVFPMLARGTKHTGLTGPKSWFLFECLDISSSWLEKPVSLWQDDSNYRYKEAEQFVRNVKVVNDLSERAVQRMMINDDEFV